MYHPNDTYLNLVGDNYKPSTEAMDKKAFDKAMNDEAERIINMLPAVLTEIIDEGASVLFDQMPECMKGEDPVTHDIINEKHIRRMLAGKISNRLGHGMGFLQK
ncbi:MULTISPECIES: hypothetical protein [Escherichia]|uniref:hypothetical protein n=1 Tax=Escherichia TaxID=561 RepID=UPI0001FB6604|nr:MULTISPECIES: hypothetical protein [Escherichia]ARV28490.1 hypothetical protein BS635_00825 [Escherichia coli]EEQ3564799.1 hypothetical protein [Escherichia coli]EES6670685.1 hypothetical protein [Escherichia coli]EES6967876.1 hypothetical protein [Escherichia coli]EEV8624730.1 hypothetical protein [Escherichia coli]